MLTLTPTRTSRLEIIALAFTTPHSSPFCEVLFPFFWRAFAPATMTTTSYPISQAQLGFVFMGLCSRDNVVLYKNSCLTQIYSPDATVALCTADIKSILDFWLHDRSFLSSVLLHLSNLDEQDWLYE